MMIAKPMGQEQFVCCQPGQELGELGLDPIQWAKDYIDQKYQAIVTDIRGKVKNEVLSQVPTIRAAVTREVMSNVPEIRAQVRTEAKSAVKPWIIATLVVGGLGLFAGGIALYKMKKKRRG
jgi:hypothetical protein